MIRYFSGSNQHHANHTFGSADEVNRAFSHAGDLPYVIGGILRASHDRDGRQRGEDNLTSFILAALRHLEFDDIEESMEYDTAVSMMESAGFMWDKYVQAGETQNDFGEDLCMGFMLIRYQDVFGRNRWSFMTALYYGTDWLKHEEDGTVPVFLAIARL